MSPPYAPYGDQAADTIYNLLFCDAIEDFHKLEPHFPPIFAAPFNEAAVRAIAEDESVESRVRVLAYERLRREDAQAPKGVVLGAIVEVSLDPGFDTLAAYADGRVRYINQSGKMSLIEDTHSPLREKALALIAAAAPLVARIGPWHDARRPPPQGDMARLSFLASDGLYFGEGPMSALAADALAAPVVDAAVALLVATVGLATKDDGAMSPS